MDGELNVDHDVAIKFGLAYDVIASPSYGRLKLRGHRMVKKALPYLNTYVY